MESGREQESGLVVESGRVVDSSRVVESSLAVGLKQCSLERELVAGRRSEHMAVVGRVMGTTKRAVLATVWGRAARKKGITCEDEIFELLPCGAVLVELAK